MPPPPFDPRNIRSGLPIPCCGYCDQPYIVSTHDHAWLCVMTTAAGEEGTPGQHIVATRSTDLGHTWSPLIPIEPANGPEASWAVPFLHPSGRIYVFYTYNAENLREVLTDYGTGKRVDTLGQYAFKFSDDHGQTWSQERYYIPVREMDIDRNNPYQGQVRFFWGVHKPILHQNSLYMGFAKVGHFGEGFMASSQACLLRCDNILTEPNPAHFQWTTLPDGPHGLTSPTGPIADEMNLVALSDGSLFATYRTVSGHPCHAYSRDRGHTWTPPAFMSYYPNGPLVDHPRAANFVWKTQNGHYLYWFHNHSGNSYEGRNPAWLLGGVEADSPAGKILIWSRPQVALYDPDRATRISYPCLLEHDNHYYLSETQKSLARTHLLDPSLLHALWSDAASTAQTYYHPTP